MNWEAQMIRFLRGLALIGLIALAVTRPALTAEPPKFQINQRPGTLYTAEVQGKRVQRFRNMSGL
jgi:hypothetical protein